VHEPPGIEVLDVEAGELGAESFAQVVPGVLGDLAQVAEGAAGLAAIVGSLSGPKMTSAITVRTSSLGRDRSNMRLALSPAGGRQRGQLAVG